ncbi:MAG: hypothetical protein RMJ33_10315 [Saprospiraceae bacterium]|nr:hypothetical protein [Saprospiraceae bacterium]MDW8230220.1 hypothetical protein [Saprospiraceae bacterium]
MSIKYLIQTKLGLVTLSLNLKPFPSRRAGKQNSGKKITGKGRFPAKTADNSVMPGQSQTKPRGRGGGGFRAEISAYF